MNGNSDTPRLLTRPALRQHLGNIPWREVETWIRQGRIPGPLYGVKPEDKLARWDRRAVDRALDAASNIPLSIEAGTAALDRACGFS